MRTITLTLVASLVLQGAAFAAAKTNTVVAVTQEQDQWCWAATTRSALLYFGVNKKQCELAEWTRVNNTDSSLDLGNDNCCTNPTGPCNSWNYFWGSGGSIEDLLKHFGTAKTTRYDLPKGALTLAQLTSAIDAGKLVFIRWEWNSGGGHFLVGDGYNGTLVHYMNPWPGEGIKVAEHAWMVSGDTHQWKSSIVVSAQGGACSNKPDGTACDDGNPCTTGDACTSGACAGAAVSCSSTNPCLTGATCNTATGLCSGGTSKAEGTTCDDGDACTTADQCHSGVCGGTAKTCAAIDACHEASTCDSATGTCTAGTSKSDGTSCDDGDACTTTDRCHSGVCGGTAKTCAAIDTCHEAGTCDSATGVCTTPTVVDGTLCSGGTCRSGVCRSPADGGASHSTTDGGASHSTTDGGACPSTTIGGGCSTSGAAGLGWSLALACLVALRRQGRRGRGAGPISFS